LDTIIFIPGFFGFGSFGEAGRPFIEYFANVEAALLRALPAPMRFVVHEPPPTGALDERVRSLHQTFLKTEGRVHLIGHSTGGLDARLFANARYNYGPDAKPLRDRLGAVVTLSAPFFGTPLARRLLLGADLAMPALWFASILASRRQLQLAGHAGALYNGFKRLLLQKATPTDELIAALADVDDATAQQIKRFLRDVSRDHPLVADILPESMTSLHREVAAFDYPRIHSFVTVAPKPGWGPRDALAFFTAPAQRLLYDMTYALCSARPPSLARLPVGPWIGAPRLPLLPESSDGIVPSWSQTLDGRADGIVVGDHLDVIGHYETAGATFLRSGSSFDDARFHALWARVAEALR
jgi:triacylglycerol lipase